MDSNSNIIEISETFSVPVEDLYKAWTDAEALKQWWHPIGDSLESVTNELNEGGVVAYEFANKGFNVSGNYSEVKPNEKLVYTWNWEFKDELPSESYTLEIGFESSESGSTLHVKQHELPDDAIAKPHKDAWHTALDSLKAYLENPKTGNTEDLKSDEGQSDRSGGYNEDPEQAKVGGG